MKKLKMILKSIGVLAAMPLLMSTESFAQGERIGNGGVGLACVKGNVISKVVLYDFAEGKAFHQDEVISNDGRSVDDYLLLAQSRFEKVHPYLGIMFKAEIEQVRSQETWRIGPFSVDLTPDTQNYGYKIRVCDDSNQDPEFHQVANYMDNIKQLRIDEKYFNKMNPLNQAGLIVHEALYKMERRVFDVKNSNNVRRVTSMLFSSNDNPNLTKELQNYYSRIFLLPIARKSDEFLGAWKKVKNHDQARTLIDTKNVITLPYGIQYNLGYTEENLPLFLMTRMNIEKYHRELGGRGLPLVVFLYSVPTAGTVGALVGGATMAAALPGLVIGVTAAVAGSAVYLIIDEVRYKQLINTMALINASEQCVGDNSKCNDEKLNKFHARYVKKYSSLSVEEYAEKILALTRKGAFALERKKLSTRNPFATVNEMHKILSDSY